MCIRDRLNSDREHVNAGGVSFVIAELLDVWKKRMIVSAGGGVGTVLQVEIRQIMGLILEKV